MSVSKTTAKFGLPLPQPGDKPDWYDVGAASQQIENLAGAKNGFATLDANGNAVQMPANVVPQTRTIAGLDLSKDRTLAELTAAGLAAGDSVVAVYPKDTLSNDQLNSAVYAVNYETTISDTSATAMGLPLACYHHVKYFSYAKGTGGGFAKQEATELNSGRNKSYIRIAAGTTWGAWSEIPVMSSGVWTPTLKGTVTAGSPTYAYQAGVWHKIGKLCFIDFSVGITAKGGISGMLIIDGLPFIPTVNSAMTVGYPLNISLSDPFYTMGGYAVASTSIIQLVTYAKNGKGNSNDANITDTFSLNSCSCLYEIQ